VLAFRSVGRDDLSDEFLVFATHYVGDFSGVSDNVTSDEIEKGHCNYKMIYHNDSLTVQNIAI
jgi:hypothetical protein